MVCVRCYRGAHSAPRSALSSCRIYYCGGSHLRVHYKWSLRHFGEQIRYWTFLKKNRRKLRGVPVTGRSRSGVDDALGWTMMGVGDAVASATALRESRDVR